ncbi:hypothetical protein [Burkholderia ubonensis]|uniref:hypothetical protein n=1 Tax=Burkholderia ubonensis TaxID=101571 RepID=UPI0012FB4F64|nr:hypothetical protein [Burkholderia ubonensis]
MDQNSGVPQPAGPVPAKAANLNDTPQLASAVGDARSVGGKFVFRYAAEVRQVGCCPPESAASLDIVGFRFAFDDIEHPDNYLPLAKIKPERVIAGQPITQCCTGYSLSVFDSLESLARKAKKIVATSPKFLRRVGDHFVVLKINPDAGICTMPNDSGHFDLFEAENFSCRAAVLAHERLPL